MGLSMLRYTRQFVPVLKHPVEAKNHIKTRLQTLLLQMDPQPGPGRTGGSTVGELS